MHKGKPTNLVGYIKKKDGSLIQVLHKKGESPRAAVTRVIRKHGGRFIGKGK